MFPDNHQKSNNGIDIEYSNTMGHLYIRKFDDGVDFPYVSKIQHQKVETIFGRPVKSKRLEALITVCLLGPIIWAPYKPAYSFCGRTQYITKGTFLQRNSFCFRLSFRLCTTKLSLIHEYPIDDI